MIDTFYNMLNHSIFPQLEWEYGRGSDFNRYYGCLSSCRRLNTWLMANRPVSTTAAVSYNYKEKVGLFTDGDAPDFRTRLTLPLLTDL